MCLTRGMSSRYLRKTREEEGVKRAENRKGKRRGKDLGLGRRVEGNILGKEGGDAVRMVLGKAQSEARQAREEAGLVEAGRGSHDTLTRMTATVVAQFRHAHHRARIQNPVARRGCAARRAQS